VTTVFGATIFLGAFLLFQVQLVIGKYILPWYGGVPMVWTICMVCFQLLLLGGYAYAHALAQQPPPRQRAIHLAVTGLALAFMTFLIARWGIPLLPASSWKPAGDALPTWHIVQVVAVAVGFPFFVISTTSPLLQAWFAQRYRGASPYRLYALSNLGSLLALITYPMVFEVWLSLRMQAWLWAGMFVVFAAGVATCARSVRRGVVAHPSELSTSAVPATAGDWTLWLALAAVPSALLLATTNYVSQEIAVVPFLWIVPLAIYLLSFVLCFEGERWYVRRVWATMLALGITLSAFVLERGVSAHILLQIGIAAFTLLAACMVCHGELARLKPAAERLTSFYLATTVGGVVGGAFVSIVAPLVFPGTWEYPLGMWMAAILALECFRRDAESPLYSSVAWPIAVSGGAAIAIVVYVFRYSVPKFPEISDPWLFGTPPVLAVAGLATPLISWRRPAGAPSPRWTGLTIVVVTVAVIGVGLALARQAGTAVSDAKEHSRSFHGIVHVEEEDAGFDSHVMKLRHGRIIHGVQYMTDEKRREPASYYGRDTGAGLAIDNHPRRREGMRVGIVGLGTGTLAAYGGPRDTYRFYELNPDVVRLAGPDGRAFTYLKESKARIEVALGDARLSLERDAPQRFDVLAIDAFSSDSVPMHLITREAVEVYLKHLAPDGILALHVSNRYLNLNPVVRGIAKEFKLAFVFISTTEGVMTWRTTWALLSRHADFFTQPAIALSVDTEEKDGPAVLWTDDYSNLLRLVKR
jgi:spermidine synthase